MEIGDSAIRVLYSFPHKIGAERICTTAWHQVDGLSKIGVEVLVLAGAVTRPFSGPVTLGTTLSWGRLRLPYRVLGTRRTCALHDMIVASRIPSLRGKIDIIHVWPSAAKCTIKAARKIALTTVLERPNAHTRFAFNIVRKECEKLGISMPRGYEHAYDDRILKREETEFALADYLLCPSEFVAKTFELEGHPRNKLIRHQYGFDRDRFNTNGRPARPGNALRMLFVGVCNPRKGLHYALDAWLKSSASQTGTFTIAGSLMPGYEKIVERHLAHPSVRFLGHRTDIPALMQQADVLVLPSIEEGSALVTSEARGAGCVLLVSEAAGAICRHDDNALIHEVGNVATLTSHIEALASNPQKLESLRRNSLGTLDDLTWEAAAICLQHVYKDVLRSRQGADSFRTSLQERENERRSID